MRRASGKVRGRKEDEREERKATEEVGERESTKKLKGGGEKSRIEKI